jgi:4,5-dihydroxyphthalate decarboxylase
VSDAPLVVAVGDYDHTRDLFTGRVAIDRVAARCVPVDTPEELFSRFLDDGDFDAAELSLAVCAILRGRGDRSVVPIPIFPARSFRHSAIYVGADGPTSAQELAGTRIGIPVWAQTAGVYVRGMLTSRYGVRLEEIRWIQAGVDVPGRREPVTVDYGRFDVRSAPDRSLDELLLAGEVDAVISARPPASIERGDPRVRRLFDDPIAEEAAYFRDTGVFPIMHALVVRRAALEREPQAPAALLAAFDDARRRSMARVAATTVPGVPLPWAATHARLTRTQLGDDWWPYGVEANRPTLEAFLRFAAEQGLTARRLAVAELFGDA